MTTLWRLIARATSGHADYDRGVRDHTSDARFAHSKGDAYGLAYWGARAIALSLLADLGHRYDARPELREEAHLCAARIMGNERVIEDTHAEIASNRRGAQLYAEAKANDAG